MIIDFADGATEDLFHGVKSARARHLPMDARKVAVRKLDWLNKARTIEDLRSPPGNRLEALKGDLAGYHSIRVNEQWRIVFRWDGGAREVRLVDYHH